MYNIYCILLCNASTSTDNNDLMCVVNESTNQRVVLWAFFEALLICVMSIGQVYYLKRFFEVRRMVWVIASARVARIALFASFRLLSAPFS